MARKVILEDIELENEGIVYEVPELAVVGFGRGYVPKRDNNKEKRKSISGLHFKILRYDYGYRDEDPNLTVPQSMLSIMNQDSQNGTFLNGVSLNYGKIVDLKDGDEIKAGFYKLRLRIKNQ